MRKWKMEDNITVSEDEVGKGKQVTQATEIVGNTTSSEEKQADDSPEEIAVKATRTRRPSKKALESADQEKEAARCRKPKKQTPLINGGNCEDQLETGHVTRQRSKSPRSTGSRSPRSSRSPRPAKELVDKPVKMPKVPKEKKAGVPKAKKSIPSQLRASKDPADEGNDKDVIKKSKKRKLTTDTGNSRAASGPPPKKVRKVSTKNKDDPDGSAGKRGAALNDALLDPGKGESEKVLSKKKQRKKPVQIEGHILLNYTKTNKSVVLTECSGDAVGVKNEGVVSIIGNEVPSPKDNSPVLADQHQKSKESGVCTDATNTNIGEQKTSEELMNAKPEEQTSAGAEPANGKIMERIPIVGCCQSQPELKVVSTIDSNNSTVDFTKRESSNKGQSISVELTSNNDSGKRISDTSEESAPDGPEINCLELIQVSNSGTCSVQQSEMTNSELGTVPGSGISVGQSQGEEHTTCGEPSADDHVGEREISGMIKVVKPATEPPKKKPRKKKEPVEGEPVKERKKARKGSGGEKTDGEAVEGTKPKKQRAKKSDTEKVEGEVTEGAPVKRKRIVKKGKLEKAGCIEGEEKADGVEEKGKKTDGSNVGGDGEVPAKVKKRVRKTTKNKIEGEDGGPVKEKKKRVRKPPGEKRVAKGTKADSDKGQKTVGGTMGEIKGISDMEKETDISSEEKVTDKGSVIEGKEQLVKSTSREVQGVGERDDKDAGGSAAEERKLLGNVPGVKNIGDGEKKTEDAGGIADVNSAQVEGMKEGEVMKSKKSGGKEEGEKKRRKRKSEDGAGEGTKQPVMCEKCGFIAASKTALKKHDIRCHNEDNEDFVKDNPFKCSICEYRAKKLSVIKRHVKKHGLEMCRFCQFVGESKVLETHVKSEHQKIAKCKKCQRRIHNEEEDYEQHVQNCQGQHVFKCEHCDKEFKYKSTLKVHQITHDASLPKRFSCEHCDYQSHFKANLQKHIESKHSADRHRSIPCPICEKLYFCEASVKKHMKSHVDVRIHTCPKCDKSFKVADVLREHLLTHLDPDKYKCEYEGCDRSFRYQRLLKSHMLEFHKEIPKKLKCPHEGCEQEFFKKSHLRRHETTHTGDRIYQCTWPDCGKAFRHADNLKVHYRQHTNEKPIQCTLCDFACRQQNSLTWHMRRQHAPKVEPTKSEETVVKNKDIKESDIKLDIPQSSDSVNDILGPDPDLKLPIVRDNDEASNHSTDSSATIEINSQTDLGSLADVNIAPVWRTEVCPPVNLDTNASQTNEISKSDSKPKKPRKKSTNTENETKPKTVRKPRKPRVRKEKVDTQPFQNALNGAIGVEPTDEKLPTDGNPSSQMVNGSKTDSTGQDGSKAPDGAAPLKPKRKRRTKEEMAAAKAAAAAAKEAAAAAKEAAAAEGGPPPKKRRRRKKDEVVADAKPCVPPPADAEVLQEETSDSDFIDRSYPYKEKRPPKGKRLLNPDKIKEVSGFEKEKENIYDFDSDDERKETQKDDYLDDTSRDTLIGQDQGQQMPHMPVTNFHDVPRQAEMMLNHATGHMVEDLMKDKASMPSRMLSDVVVALSPLDLDKIDRRELLETQENVPMSAGQQHPDDSLKDGISASDIERDVREIIEKDGVGVPGGSSDLPDEAHIFVDNNDDFPDRSDGEIIDRQLLQKYLEDTNMEDFERDLMKEDEKAQASRNQFDNYVSPERQPMSVQPMKGDSQFDNYVSPERQPLSVQPMKGEGQFDNYVSPECQPMSAQPTGMKGEGQPPFDNYASPEKQPMSVQPIKPDGQYDKYVSPEQVQVMSNQSVVNHDTMSLPSNASQHGDSQWKTVEPNKNPVIGAVDSPWAGPTESDKQKAESRIFDPYAPEKVPTIAPSLPEKSPYPNHLDSRDSSAYRIPDYGSMYDTTTRMLASGLSSYPPVSADSPHPLSRPSTSFDPKDMSLGYSQTPTPYLQGSGLYGTNPASNSYIDPRVDPYASSQLPSHPGALQGRDNPLNSLAMSASKYIESEINKTRVYNQQGWTLQETQSLRLTHSLFPKCNNDWEPSSRPSSGYSYLSERDMAGYGACSTGRPPALTDRLSAGYLSAQTADSLEKQAFDRYDMANYLNSRHAGVPQPPSFNFDRQIAPLSGSTKAFADSYRSAPSIPDYRGLPHSATPDLYTPNLNLDKYFYRDSMYASQRVPLPSENPFLSQPSAGAQSNFPREYARGSVYSQPSAYPLMDNGKYSDPGKFAQPISSMQGREIYLPRPGSATGHIQDPYRPPMLYNMMNRYFE